MPGTIASCDIDRPAEPSHRDRADHHPVRRRSRRCAVAGSRRRRRTRTRMAELRKRRHPVESVLCERAGLTDQLSEDLGARRHLCVVLVGRRWLHEFRQVWAELLKRSEPLGIPTLAPDRRRYEDDATHALGVANRGLRGDTGTQRVAEHVGLAEPEVLRISAACRRPSVQRAGRVHRRTRCGRDHRGPRR